MLIVLLRRLPTEKDRNMRRIAIIIAAVVTLAACATTPPEDLSREAFEHGFTVIPDSYRSPKGDTYAEVGVLVGACTGTYSKPTADGYAYLKVYNPESGVTIVESLREPTLATVMSTPPAMTACKPSETSASSMPTSTTAR